MSYSSHSLDYPQIDITSHKNDGKSTKQNYTLGKFNFHEANNLVNDEIGDPSAWTVSGLIKHALEFGLESEKNMQELFAAKQEAQKEFGHIFPQINALATLEAGSGHVSVEAVLPFFGFIFPNRWFSFFAAGSGLKATEENLATLFANTVQEIEHLYYDIQLQKWSLRVMDFYLTEYEKVIELIENKIASGSQKFTSEHLSIFKIQYNELTHKRAFLDSLAAALPHMATILGLDSRVDWADLKIHPTMIDLDDQPKRYYNEFYSKAVANSSEIRTLRHMIKAAKRTMRANYFTFLDPHSGRDLGLHYLAHIKIARSKITSLEIDIGLQKNKISSALQESLNKYTEATKSTHYLRRSLLNELENLRLKAEEQLIDEDEHKHFDVVTVTRYFDEAKKQALNFIYSYFVYRTAVADFNRYTREGEYYQLVENYRNLVPAFLKKIEREHSFRYRAIKSLRSMTAN